MSNFISIVIVDTTKIVDLYIESLLALYYFSIYYNIQQLHWLANNLLYENKSEGKTIKSVQPKFSMFYS